MRKFIFDKTDIESMISISNRLKFWHFSDFHFFHCQPMKKKGLTRKGIFFDPFPIDYLICFQVSPDNIREIVIGETLNLRAISLEVIWELNKSRLISLTSFIDNLALG